MSTMHNKEKKILITGGNGFIGRNLKEGLGDIYTVFAPSSAELDLLDEGKVAFYLEKNQFDVVIHCANHDDSRNTKKDPTQALKNNLQMFLNLVQHKDLYKRMFYFGSGRGYDQRFYVPMMAEDYLGQHIPVDDYGFGKYLMAKYAEHTDNIHELRLFGCFGKYEDWEIRLISYACCKAMFNQDILIHQNRRMSFLYIDDLVAIIKVLLTKEQLHYTAYNICPDETIDLLTCAKKVLEISSKNVHILTKVADQGLDYTGANVRIKREIGDFVFTTMDHSIHDLYRWYEQNKVIVDEKLLLLNK